MKNDYKKRNIGASISGSNYWLALASVDFDRQRVQDIVGTRISRGSSAQPMEKRERPAHRGVLRRHLVQSRIGLVHARSGLQHAGTLQPQDPVQHMPQPVGTPLDARRTWLLHGLRTWRCCWCWLRPLTPQHTQVRRGGPDGSGRVARGLHETAVLE